MFHSSNNLFNLKDLIRKSSQLANFSLNHHKNKEKEKEKSLWNQACFYVQKAQEIIQNNYLSEHDKQKISLLELEILESGCPRPIEFTLFNDHFNTSDSSSNNNNNENNNNNNGINNLFSSGPPLPSEWNDLNQMHQKIITLEKEKKILEPFYWNHKNYQELEERFSQYKHQTEYNQEQLQNEIDKLNYQIKDTTQMENDIKTLEKEIFHMRDKHLKYKQTNQRENEELLIELNNQRQSLHHYITEVKKLQQSLETYQKKYNDEKILNKQLTQDIQNLHQQIHQFQNICTDVVCILDADQQSEFEQIVNKHTTN